jgi:hypothetical protein
VSNWKSFFPSIAVSTFAIFKSWNRLCTVYIHTLIPVVIILLHQNLLQQFWVAASPLCIRSQYIE